MAKPMGSVVTALRVLELVSREQPVGVTDIARMADLPKTSAHRMLTTLAAAGWLRQNNAGAWALSLRAAAVGRRVLYAPALQALAVPVMRDLAGATNESVRLWLIENDSFVLAENVEGSHAVRPVVSEISNSHLLHTTAVGKAVLATWDPCRLDHYLERPLVGLTDQTVTEPAQLRAQLRVIQARGYAEAWNEAHVDVGGVATVLALPGGGQAALAVTFPTHRLTDELAHQFGRLLIEAAHRIQLMSTP